MNVAVALLTAGAGSVVAATSLVIWSGALRGGTRRRDAAGVDRRLPPRPPAKAAVVGTTWRERGVAYWARRIGFTAAMALAVANATQVLAAFFANVRGISDVAFFAALSADVLVTLATGYRAVVTFRSPAYGSLAPAAWEQKVTQWVGTLPGMVGFVAVLLLTIAAIAWLGLVGVVIAVAFSYGPAFVILLRSFLPTLDFERPARRRCGVVLGD